MYRLSQHEFEMVRKYGQIEANQYVVGHTHRGRPEDALSRFWNHYGTRRHFPHSNPTAGGWRLAALAEGIAERVPDL